MKVKIHKGARIVVAICDSDLIGKVFEDEKRKLDLTTTFFDGDEKDSEEVREIINFYKQEDACFNVVGNKTIKLAKECKVIEDLGIAEINGISFGLVLI